jgi:thymidylate kinase
LKNDYTYIFLDLPIVKIKDRMQERGDCVEWKDFENRLSSAKKETALKNLADFVINADQSPDKVFEDIFNIISKKL